MDSIGSYQCPSFEAMSARLEKADVPGEHLWVITGAWIVTDPEGKADDFRILDRENLAVLTSPGCYKCSELYNPVMAVLPCQGSLTPLPGEEGQGRRSPPWRRSRRGLSIST